MAKAAPLLPARIAPPARVFALTEPLPFVGVETNILSGKVRIAEWTDGQEPLLQVDKRGRFITNMGFANFVTAAVDSADERISRSCMIILEQGDPGIFDPGTPTKKLVHQLSSTTDPVFSLRVPASRIIGGYTIKDGKIVPHYSHSEVIEAVFRRTRVTVGLMSAAKLLSAIEPVIRYHRHRFRGGESVNPGSPRYELGLQGKEDVLHRLVDVWATGEAASSLGFAAARLFDELDPLERAKEEIFAQQKIEGARAQFRALQKVEKEALEFLALGAQPVATRDQNRYAVLEAAPLIQFAWRDALANVLCPAVKLWNTSQAATMMREAVSLVGGYGITEDCPGFLGQKWMDVQLEATYEGPEAVQRRQLSVTMTNDLFLACFQHGIDFLAQIAAAKPGTGACTLGTAMQLWLWTLRHLEKATDPEGRKLFHSNRQGVSFPLADALCWLLAVRQFLFDVLELEKKGPANPTLAEGLDGLLAFFTDLCHVQAARAAGEVGRICAELVFGYHRHPAWDDGNCAACYSGTSAPGECLKGLEEFVRLRARLDGCLTGARLAKERAAEALTKVMIPEALDYPQ